MNHFPPAAPYRDMITELVKDGWNTTAGQHSNQAPSLTRTELTCPANFLRMTIELSGDAVVRCRLGIQPGGTGEPARWRAAATAAPAAYWLTAARATLHAVRSPERVNLFPGDALTRLGWKHLDTWIDTCARRTMYTSPTSSAHVSYRPPQRAIPAVWTITRPDASIGVLVKASEPRALPALILAFALTTTCGTTPSTTMQPDPRPHE